jgi:hypothetical protein
LTSVSLPRPSGHYPARVYRDPSRPSRGGRHWFRLRVGIDLPVRPPPALRLATSATAPASTPGRPPGTQCQCQSPGRRCPGRVSFLKELSPAQALRLGAHSLTPIYASAARRGEATGTANPQNGSWGPRAQHNPRECGPRLSISLSSVLDPDDS